MTRRQPPGPDLVRAARRDPLFIAAVAADPDPQWRTRSRCAGSDPELFFTDDYADLAYARKRFCGVCAVRAECLADALEMRDEFGLRAGLRPGERRAMVAAWSQRDRMVAA